MTDASPARGGTGRVALPDTTTGVASELPSTRQGGGGDRLTDAIPARGDPGRVALPDTTTAVVSAPPSTGERHRQEAPRDEKPPGVRGG